MALPIFYTNTLGDGVFTLDEATSKHVVQVLRMQAGEQLQITDGKGNLVTGEILDPHKKHCTVKPTRLQHLAAPSKKNTIAISLLKNASRFEWFLEKIVELGIDEVVPLICGRTEKQHFRYDRLQAIVQSAMLQSQQVYLCNLHQPIHYKDWIFRQKNAGKLFIAHCLDYNSGSKSIFDAFRNEILIGPEGDFTKEEISMALEANYEAISLGPTRLRTETAGVVAATLVQLSV